jgi:hypothetical protein
MTHHMLPVRNWALPQDYLVKTMDTCIIFEFRAREVHHGKLFSFAGCPMSSRHLRATDKKATETETDYRDRKGETVSTNTARSSFARPTGTNYYYEQ